MERKKIIVIVGPTASGKSALAVRLARRFGGEIISADSRQVYRGLDIGTGKIKVREMQGVPHHLLDVASPRRTFTAADFVHIGRKACSNVLNNNKIPIICGGTGFYIDALLGRVALSDVPPNPKLRARLEKKTADELFLLLKKHDPRRAREMNESDRCNPRRLIRALEIARYRNQRYLDLRNPNFETLWVSVMLPKEVLKRRIRVRLLERMRHGMVAEAKRLHAHELSYKRMEQLGLEYHSLARFLQKKITRDELIAELERDIYRYAKRQLTYWKRNKNIKWFSPNNKKQIERVVQKWLKT